MTTSRMSIPIAATPNHHDFFLLQADRVDTFVDAKPVKVLYKDAEGINTFCINKVNSILSNVAERSRSILRHLFSPYIQVKAVFTSCAFNRPVFYGRNFVDKGNVLGRFIKMRL